MFIVQKLSLILSSAALVAGIVGCSGPSDESPVTNESADGVETMATQDIATDDIATDDIAAEDGVQQETSDVIEKQTGFITCYTTQPRCEIAKEEFEDLGNICGPCVLGGSCGTTLFTLFCDVAP
jgi:hypothetical protein